MENNALVRVTMWNEVNGLLLARNRGLKVIDLAKAFKTSEEGEAEVVKNDGFVRMIIQSEVNSILLSRNCPL